MYANQDDKWENYNTHGQTETIDSLYEKMYGEEDSHYYDPQKKKPSSSFPRKVLVGSLIFTTLIAAVGISIPVFLKSSFGSKVRVEKAVAALASDMQSTSEMTMSPAQMEEVFNMVAYGDTYSEYSLNVSGIENLPVTLGVDGETTRLFDDRKMESENTLSVMNSKIAEAKMVASDNDMYICVPSLAESYYMVNMENFAEEVNGSEITGLLGVTVPEGDYRLFGDGISKDIHLSSDTPLARQYSDELKNIAENMQVKRLSDTSEVTLTNGDTLECTIYSVKITKEDATSLLSSILTDQLYNNPMWAQRLAGADGTIDSVSVERDIELEIMIDGQGHIRGADTVNAVELTHTCFELHAELAGVKNSTDEVTMTVNASAIKTNGYTPKADKSDASGMSYVVQKLIDALMTGDNTFRFASSVDEEGLVRTNTYVSGDFEAGFSFEGKLDYDSTKKKLEADINKLGVSYAGKDMVRVSGEMDVEPAHKGASDIEIPKDDAVDLFHMNLLDILGLSVDWESSLGYLEDLYSVFGGLF